MSEPESTARAETKVESTKFCGYCGRYRPAYNFRFRDAAHTRRHPQCRTCHNQEKRERSRQKRERKIKAFSRDVNRERTTANRTLKLVDEMMRRFRGPDNFAKVWFEMIDSAKQEGRILIALRSTNALLKAWSAAEERKHDLRPDASCMNADQIQEEKVSMLLEVIEAQPQLAVLAAQRLGWRVEPITTNGD